MEKCDASVRKGEEEGRSRRRRRRRRRRGDLSFFSGKKNKSSMEDDDDWEPRRIASGSSKTRNILDETEGKDDRKVSILCDISLFCELVWNRLPN